MKDSGFKPNTYAFLHTIAYTIRGFMESSFILDEKKFWDASYNLANKLFLKYERKRKLPGAYYENFKDQR